MSEQKLILSIEASCFSSFLTNVLGSYIIASRMRQVGTYHFAVGKQSSLGVSFNAQLVEGECSEYLLLNLHH